MDFFIVFTGTICYTAIMKIQSAEFIKGVIQDRYQGIDTTLPQVVFYGRSNAGKSSTINAVAGRKALARTSHTPGRTREINFFLMDHAWYLVDMPGYGYARLSHKERATLQYLIKWFITETHADARLSVLIIDSKIGLTESDREILDLLMSQNERVIILMNKIDRLKQSELAHSIKRVAQDVPPLVTVIPFSAKTKKGLEILFAKITETE